MPTQWDELSGKQLIAALQAFNALSGIALQIRLFKIVSGASWLRLILAGSAAYITDKLYLINFLFDFNTLTKNPLPRFRNWYGPTDELNNLQVCEFIFSETYYQQYKDSGDNNHLHNLIATLYRPAKRSYDRKRNEDGDIREAFNDNLTKLYATRVAKWPPRAKKAILFWYEGCRAFLINSNPDVFGSVGEPAKYGLWSVMRGIAEKNIHGNINSVEKMYVKVFLMELNELVEESRRIKDASNKQ